ncbi:MAG: amidohydrolase family protein [Marinirhabdus sp.]|nr:amidohydrolase family protein [Marinirhabdus sp.]
MNKICVFIFLAVIHSSFSQTADVEQSTTNLKYTGPIIDMHMHAEGDATLPPMKLGLCLPLSNLVPHFDAKEKFEMAWTAALQDPKCEEPYWSATSYNEYTQNIALQLDKLQITPVVSGSATLLEKWSDTFGDKIIPSLEFQIGRDTISVDRLREIIKTHDIKVFGEISNQYAGIAPNDPRMDPYYALAQELDLPIGIHMGTGAPGSPYLFSPDYVAAYSNPLLLEEVLKKFPRLRVFVMHYGEPFIDEMITMMYHYPQLYVDLGGIQWAYPSDYFYEYHLKKLVYAGFGKRILFGSDTFLWPGLLEKSIEIINEADFLTYEQKADIFYNNAFRFLRME